MEETKLTRRSFLGVAGTAAASMALVGCGGGGSASTQDTQSSTEEEPAAEAAGGILYGGLAYSGDNFDPLTTSQAFPMTGNFHVIEGLYGIDYHDYTTFPELADGNPEMIDEVTWEVTLRSGAQFSDGTDVTVDDVIASFDGANVEGGLYNPMLTVFESIEKKDDTTLTITTAYENLSEDLLKSRLAIVRVVPASMSEDERKAQPTGSGPWMYDTIDDTKMTMLPNPNYNGNQPALADGIQFDCLVDSDARLVALESGDDYAAEAVPATEVDRLEGAGTTVDSVLGFATRFIMFNVAKEPWNDPKVRQAVMYALNTEQMLVNVFDGAAEIPTSYLPKNHANYHKASTTYTYDPSQAEQLLSEAGITPGDVNLCSTDNSQVVAMTTQIKNDLDALGFNVSLANTNLKSSDLYANLIDTGEYDILVAPGDPSCFGADADLLMAWWYGDNSWMTKRCPWKDSDEWQELHQLMSDALGQSGSEQQSTWNECFDILADNVPLYPLFHVNTITASWSDTPAADGLTLKGFAPISCPGLIYNNVSLA